MFEILTSFKNIEDKSLLTIPICVTNNCYEPESDPRHAELIVVLLDLKAGKGVTTLGIDDPEDDKGRRRRGLGFI